MNYFYPDKLSSHCKLVEHVLEVIDGLVIVDAQGKIVYLDKWYANILEIDPANTIGKHIKDIIPNTRMHLVLETGKEDIGSVFKMNNGDSVIVNRIPIKSGDEIIGVVSIPIFTKMDDFRKFTTQINKLTEEINLYRTDLATLRGAKYSLDQIIGNTAAMQSLKKLVVKIAQTKSTVVIMGETGTGKELFAHAIHQQSPRQHNSFIRLNCAAIPKDLLESELFGYEEGAFTGAKKGGKPGKFELANGGTLLLDEINQMPMDLQAKMLRVLQEKEIERVGGSSLIRVDVRLICTSNQDLFKLVNENKFREDLYYRINVVNINVPPLRERIDDLPCLIEYCLTKINKELGLSIEGIAPEVVSLFRKYSWPGNVRELQNVLERSANLFQSGFLEVKHFENLQLRLHHQSSSDNGTDNNLEEIRSKVEREAILQALSKTNGNKKLAARILNIDRSVLYNKIKKYNIPL